MEKENKKMSWVKERNKEANEKTETLGENGVEDAGEVK